MRRGRAFHPPPGRIAVKDALPQEHALGLRRSGCFLKEAIKSRSSRCSLPLTTAATVFAGALRAQFSSQVDFEALPILRSTVAAHGAVQQAFPLLLGNRVTEDGTEISHPPRAEIGVAHARIIQALQRARKGHAELARLRDSRHPPLRRAAPAVAMALAAKRAARLHHDNRLSLLRGATRRGAALAISRRTRRALPALSRWPLHPARHHAAAPGRIPLFCERSGDLRDAVATDRAHRFASGCAPFITKAAKGPLPGKPPRVARRMGIQRASMTARTSPFPSGTDALASAFRAVRPSANVLRGYG